MQFQKQEWIYFFWEGGLKMFKSGLLKVGQTASAKVVSRYIFFFLSSMENLVYLFLSTACVIIEMSRKLMDETRMEDSIFHFLCCSSFYIESGLIKYFINF